MAHYKYNLGVLAIAVGFSTQPTLAADIRIDGFASFVAGQTLDDDEGPMLGRGYYDKMSYDDDSLYGIQFRADLQDGLSATAQIVGKGADGYDAQVNWAYFTYELNDTMSLKVGRQRPPLFYFSDFLDVGYAYHWISPPSEVYDIGVDTVDAINFEHYTELGDWTSRLNFLFGGIDTTINGNRFLSEDSTTVAWSLNRDWFTVRATYSQSKSTVDVVTELAEGINRFVPLTAKQLDYLSVEEDPSVFAGIAMSADWGKYFFITEYTSIEIEDSPISNDRKSWYVSGGYRLNKFTFSITYSQIDNPYNQDAVDAVASVEPILGAIAGGLGGSELASAGASQILEAIPQLYRNGVESESYNFTVRYDFHSSAALKFDYTSESAEYDQGYGMTDKKDPQLIRVGVDLTF